MKIGVVSDTHSRSIPRGVIEDFKKVDLIVHAGDFCSVEDLDFLEQIKEVKAVCGNMDEAAVRRKLPPRLIFECEGIKIGVYHGRGAKEQVLGYVQEEFKNDKVQVVIFGHSHRSLNKKIAGVLYFNPGSPNDSINAPFCSYGILEIHKGQVDGTIVKVKE